MEVPSARFSHPCIETCLGHTYQLFQFPVCCCDNNLTQTTVGMKGLILPHKLSLEVVRLEMKQELEVDPVEEHCV